MAHIALTTTASGEVDACSDCARTFACGERMHAVASEQCAPLGRYCDDCIAAWRVASRLPAAWRSAGRMADSTVVANQTFGRAAIAALQGWWYADTDRAELRFRVDGHACWLAQDTAPPATTWVVGCMDPCAKWTFVVPAGMPVAEAAEQLHMAVEPLRAPISGMNEVEV